MAVERVKVLDISMYTGFNEALFALFDLFRIHSFHTVPKSDALRDFQRDFGFG